MDGGGTEYPTASPLEFWSVAIVNGDLRSRSEAVVRMQRTGEGGTSSLGVINGVM